MNRRQVIIGAAAALVPTPALATTITRLGQIIFPNMLPGTDGVNINGPSIIKVPSWISNPLGAYYLYFAHHKGTYIRMAYGDSPNGPFTFYGQTLKLSQVTPLGAFQHIASPEVYVDEVNHKIVMYAHSPTNGGPQRMFRATSGNGLTFSSVTKTSADAYLRRFVWNGFTYGIAKGTNNIVNLYRSGDSGVTFKGGPRDINVGGEEWRHTGLRIVGSTLEVYFSRTHDAPERILRTTIDLTPDWSLWALGPLPYDEIMQSETDYEGVNLPIMPGHGGEADEGGEHALRDPYIYEEGGTVYLYNAVAGESGIEVSILG